MPKFRKKPVVIEAFLLKEPRIPHEIAVWCNGRVCGVGDVGAKVWIEIDTLEGTMRADYGDFIIKGVKGEFYPCKPDIFDATYELVEETQAAATSALPEMLPVQSSNIREVGYAPRPDRSVGLHLALCMSISMCLDVCCRSCWMHPAKASFLQRTFVVSFHSTSWKRQFKANS